MPDGQEHFLVDGVAPAVIGGGPPEPASEPRRPPANTEPPTSPIPVLDPYATQPRQEKRGSWVSRMFRSE
ncbi:hypothetical protein [Actinophytocola oryzae]|uniref:Uncharacterized protein n=1 Tax=Actinophytocola oryzae TaxID=502181 RepID=A0A4R7VB80_9PSEU|nr:hypothetical protein [Actinophytocola oryzae]TDV46280.1 hypothetical protein CLV71_111238 [Actinophytocola oryzae]